MSGQGFITVGTWGWVRQHKYWILNLVSSNGTENFAVTIVMDHGTVVKYFDPLRPPNAATDHHGDRQADGVLFKTNGLKLLKIQCWTRNHSIMHVVHGGLLFSCSLCGWI